LSKALHTSYTTYLKTERDQRELSFLMALKICKFYKIDIHDFVVILSEKIEVGQHLPESTIMKNLVLKVYLR